MDCRTTYRKIKYLLVTLKSQSISLASFVYRGVCSIIQNGRVEMKKFTEVFGMAFLILMACSVAAYPYSLKEDAEDGDTVGWTVADDNPAGATVTNVYDEASASNVIRVNGPGGYSNAVRLSWPADQDNNLFKFSMNYEGGGTSDLYSIFVLCELDSGERLYVTYLPHLNINDSKRVASGNYYIYHNLGYELMDHSWHTIERDLEADIQAVEATGIPEFAGFGAKALDHSWNILFRGNMLIDNIILDSPADPSPKLIRFQGNLKDTSGLPLEGVFNVTLRLYEYQDSQTATWEEVQQVKIDTGGLDVELGSVEQLNIPFDRQYWLGIEVESDGEMAPRFKLTSVPYALSTE